VADRGFQELIHSTLKGENMKVTDPEKLNEYHNDRFRAGDLDGLVNLYEADAVLCPAPGVTLKGAPQIREQMAALLTLQGELSATQLSCVRYGEFALLHAHWIFKGKDASGHAVDIGGHSSKLARRDADGSWKYVIDLPVALQ
jgi:ketosteroid isomerase-like protein